MSWLNPDNYAHDLLESNSTKVLELAKLVSLSPRIEPLLLRNMRLKFLPGSEPELEYQLWFSSLITARSTQNIVLYHDVARLLAGELKSSSEFAEVWRYTQECTAHWSDLDRLEQQIRFESLKENNQLEIDKCLQQVLRQLTKAQSEHERLSLARWAKNTLPMLNTTQPSDEIAWLAQYSATALGAITNWTTLSFTEPMPDWLAMALPAASETFAPGKIGIALRYDDGADHLVLECKSVDSAGQTLELPTPLPARLYIKGDEQNTGSWEVINTDSRIKISPPSKRIELRTIDGKRYELLADFEPSSKPSNPAKPEIYLTYVSDDSELALRISQQLTAQNIKVALLQESPGAPQTSQELGTSRKFLRLWTPAAQKQWQKVDLADVQFTGSSLLLQWQQTELPKGTMSTQMINLDDIQNSINLIHQWLKTEQSTSVETKPLPKYSECEYSLFVSYAHRDDESENMWVSRLKQAIWMRLADLKRDIPKRQLHMSGDNGPSAGHLSDALKDRVKESFGMLLVVGDGYVDSSWCEKELELFADIFGPSGTTSRLYIVAMTQDALDKASSGPFWKQFVAPDQLWVPMYQDTNPKKPIKPGAGNSEAFDERFFEQAAKIADRLIEEIEKDWLASYTKGQPNPPEIEASGKVPLRIAFAPTTSSELDKYALALSKLITTQATCFQIPKSLIDQYDPDDGASIEELRNSLKQADVLIVPFWEVTPLAPFVKGGHLGILDQEWRTLQKSRKAIWYKPPCAENLKLPADKHLDVIRNLSPLCVSEEAILSLVFGQQQGGEIRICIENHPLVKVYEPLIEKIEEIWVQLSFGESAPRIRCEPLDMDNLDDAPKDVSGVLLIYPIGLKPIETLKRQMAKVEKAIPKTGAAYPGRVLLVYQHDSQLQFLERSWPNIKCKLMNNKAPVEFDLHPDGELELQAFLIKILRKFNRSKETAYLL